MIDTFGQLFLKNMILKFAQKVFNFLVLSNLSVVVATAVCFVSFAKLPNGQAFNDYLSLAQLCLTCWAIYIFDRLKDNVSSEEITTERHQFHFKYQFILQILMISAVTISVVMAFFQPTKLIVYGLILGIFVLIYLYYITQRWPFLKEIFMPLIYTLAVVGVPFTLNSSISFSSWLLGFMFFGAILQNSLSFSYFETIVDKNIQNLTTKMGEKASRRVINLIAAFQIFVVIIFFSSQAYYPNLLSFVLVFISITTSLVVANSALFQKNYRWVIDALLFLPLVII
jgi:hypothetical protein